MLPADIAIVGRSAEEEMQVDARVRIIELALVEQFEDFHAQSGFLGAFADGAVGRGLTGPALAAGELGAAGEGTFGAADADEASPGVLDDGNADGGGGAMPRAGATCGGHCELSKT